VEREVGRGGMAIVLLARDRKLGRQVAIKVLSPDVATSVATERFLREIRITAQLQHPNILPLIDSGEAAGLLYSVMPFLEGSAPRRATPEATSTAPGASSTRCSPDRWRSAAPTSSRSWPSRLPRRRRRCASFGPKFRLVSSASCPDPSPSAPRTATRRPASSP